MAPRHDIFMQWATRPPFPHHWDVLVRFVRNCLCKGYCFFPTVTVNVQLLVLFESSLYLCNQQEHYERTMNDRMKEQDRLIREGFKEEAERLRKEIDALKKPKKKKKGCVVM